VAPSSRRSRDPIRVVLSSAALLPFMSVWRAAAFPIAQLGVGAFFIAGVMAPTLGKSAGWLVLAATALAALLRAIEIESWAFLIPGGLVGRVKYAFSGRAARAATAFTLVERLVLGALASVVVGHYIADVMVMAIAGLRFEGSVSAEDLATLVAVAMIGWLWLRGRVGRDIDSDFWARAVWIGTGILALTMVVGVVTLARGSAAEVAAVSVAPSPNVTGKWFLDAALLYVLGFAQALPAIGGGEALARAAHEFPPPRVPTLRRTALLTVLFALLVTSVGTFLFVVLVPVAEQPPWVDSPLVGLAQHLAVPAWMRGLLSVALGGAAFLVLCPVTEAALTDAERILHRSSVDEILPGGLASLHTRFGTPARAIDVTAASMILVMLASGGRVTWLAHVYAIGITGTVILTVAALMRLRRLGEHDVPVKTPGNVRVWGREVPLGLLLPAFIVAGSALAMLATGDGASIASVALVVALASWFTLSARDAEPAAAVDEPSTFDLLRSTDLSLDQVEARPGNVLVPVRNPHALAHVAAALQTAGDRDVVVMTVRLIDVDTGSEAAIESAPTRYERQVLAEVVSVAERLGRPVRLLIVPARNVVDAIVATVLRLRSSDVYVGESSSLSVADQARLLGEAWEQAEKPVPLDVRLVIYHRSGRADSYHLGAHPPSLSPGDLDLIHRVWLDAVKSVGPHVHHHDVVRAALTQMEHQLTGPQRDDALAAIRETARPADELAGALRARDYARLRDMMRNRHASDVATLLTELTIEDQVVVFRVLPRKDAAAVFEYLSLDAKEALLKAMAQEDVAALLNNMAPDDRTLFLEELPAAVTRQLLALLTPAERSVALTLLGYPERSVGRLMTPHYVAVREHWMVREVLDYVRSHGQDSETLNVIYVVDEQGALIDDIRIREFLLAPLDRQVTDLMDRRFVALKASEDQEAAVAVFRQYDRTALPVTDTTGMLIGIVTIDDVLDVAEATATRDIQRIGGSEALDEPYISIGFGRMIRKRAGWLTALFLGEMLTATAMGVFEAEISKAVVLALFVPLIISSGGNSGSQAATLVIRALALGEVGVRDWWRVMRREIFAGLALGGILGSIGFLRISLWSAFSDIYGAHWLLVAITVSVSLVGVVLWGTLSGSLLPFLLKRLGFDPATSSAPFVATLVDVTGLVIYFSVGLVVLRGTLL
jgi:magnesium transporter